MQVLNAPPGTLTVDANYFPTRCCFAINVVHSQMLDAYPVIGYLAPMSTMFHPPIYYKVRSIVRWLFWTMVYFIALVLFGLVLEGDQSQECDVDLLFNFTWTSDKPIDLSQCVPPSNVTLFRDGRWAWTE